MSITFSQPACAASPATSSGTRTRITPSTSFRSRGLVFWLARDPVRRDICPPHQSHCRYWPGDREFSLSASAEGGSSNSRPFPWPCLPAPSPPRGSCHIRKAAAAHSVATRIESRFTSRLRDSHLYPRDRIRAMSQHAFLFAGRGDLRRRGQAAKAPQNTSDSEIVNNPRSESDCQVPPTRLAYPFTSSTAGRDRSTQQKPCP